MPLSEMQTKLNVPYYRVSLGEREKREVSECLQSGWLTTGPRTKEFEIRFADAVRAKHAVALNSGTAALHLGVEALGLKGGEAVLVPSMTFAATAEVVRYQGAVPVLVDCDPTTLNMDLADAQRKLEELKQGHTPLDPDLTVVGMIPVHVGGMMMDMSEIERFATKHNLWVVEDAAHAFPAAYRHDSDRPWRRCGQNTANVTCFSFYANKTITTGEGGMAVTDNLRIAERIKRMSLHGLSRDAWNRYGGNGSWDYGIVAPGYKYNITDIASGIGLGQLERAETLRSQRECIAGYYRQKLEQLEEIELPADPPNRIHSWHLFPIRLRLPQVTIDRNAFIEELRERGVGCSVHWRPLHLHPYYVKTFAWEAEQLPNATAEWERLISIPLFPGMREEEMQYVVQVIEELCQRFSKRSFRMPEGTESRLASKHPASHSTNGSAVAASE